MRASIQCSCGCSIPMSDANYRGAMVFPGTYLLLFNCDVCKSTRAQPMWQAEESAEESQAA